MNNAHKILGWKHRKINMYSCVQGGGELTILRLELFFALEWHLGKNNGIRGCNFV